MAELTVLVDTNVLIAAMLGSQTVRHTLRAIITQRRPWLITPALILELTEVSGRTKFDGIITSAMVARMRRRLELHARMIHPHTLVTVCRDPRDNHVLAAAVDGHATHLISGDRDVLTLSPFHGVRILQPREFLNVVQR